MTKIHCDFCGKEMKAGNPLKFSKDINITLTDKNNRTLKLNGDVVIYTNDQFDICGECITQAICNQILK